MTTVKGYCPMGCGETLFLGSGGYVTCSLIGCPNPAAMTEIMEDRETEHIVVLSARDFSVQHPLRERLAGLLHECELHRRLRDLAGPPAMPGTYRVRADSLPPHWEPIPEVTS